MLVKAIQNFAGENFSYSIGDVAEIPEKVAQSWIEHGLATPADDNATPIGGLTLAQLNSEKEPETTEESTEATGETETTTAPAEEAETTGEPETK